jgi:hypothetical protein
VDLTSATPSTRHKAGSTHQFARQGLLNIEATTPRSSERSGRLGIGFSCDPVVTESLAVIH